MTTLQKMARYIAESNLDEEEIYEILHTYMKRKMNAKYIEGWLRRDGVSVRSKAAQRVAQQKISAIDADLSLYLNVDFSQPLSGEVLVIRGNDVIEVKYLSVGDLIVANGDQAKVLEIKEIDGKFILKLR